MPVLFDQRGVFSDTSFHNNRYGIFFRPLKQYQTFEEASANIGQFIDDVYNTKRLHSSLGYVPPSEFEMAYYQDVQC